tara:strand:- start:3500 stop:3856 length:357 start_codon:yes stop_codon:yes gene_type:complete
MQQSQKQQKQTKRRRPHYNLCEGRSIPCALITLDEEKETLAKNKKIAEELCKENNLFNRFLKGLAKEANLEDIVWQTYDERSPQEKLSYLGYMEVLQILSDKYRRSKLINEIKIMTSN